MSGEGKQRSDERVNERGMVCMFEWAMKSRVHAAQYLWSKYTPACYRVDQVKDL